MTPLTSLALLALFLPTGTNAGDVTSQEKFLSPGAERAIDRGLEFLAKQGRKDGGIHNGGHHVGSTGIALLAFLANGHLPGKGEYGAVVKKGMAYLLKVRDPYTGMLGQSMYEHGFAMLALADMWGELKDADSALQEGIEAALALALHSQRNNPLGAWRYSPQEQSADVSVASAVLQGVRACREAIFEVPEKSMDQAAGFFIACANRDGGFAYVPPGGQGGSNVCRTGIGIMGLMACGQSHRPEVKRGVEWLRKHPQLNEMPAYSAYYAVLAMYQARTLVGDAVWDEWYPKIQQQILRMQQRDGSFNGQTAGPVIDTGFMVIALSIQKGLLPLFQR